MENQQDEGVQGLISGIMGVICICWPIGFICSIFSDILAFIFWIILPIIGIGYFVYDFCGTKEKREFRKARKENMKKLREKEKAENEKQKLEARKQQQEEKENFAKFKKLVDEDERLIADKDYRVIFLNLDDTTNLKTYCWTDEKYFYMLNGSKSETAYNLYKTNFFGEDRIAKCDKKGIIINDFYQVITHQFQYEASKTGKIFLGSLLFGTTGAIAGAVSQPQTKIGINKTVNQSITIFLPVVTGDKVENWQSKIDVSMVLPLSELLPEVPIVKNEDRNIEI